LAVERGLVAGGKHFLGRFFDETQRFGQRVARIDVGGDDRGAEPIEVIQLLRRDGLGDRDQVGELRQLTVDPTHVDRRKIRRLTAVLVLELDDDVVLLAFPLEAGDLAAAQHRLERTPYRLHLYAYRHGLFAVDVHRE